MSKLYDWLEACIREYYQFVRVLKKQEDKEVLLYRNKEADRPVVVKRMNGVYPVYERLTQIKNPYFITVLEYANRENESLVIEEYVDGLSLADFLENGVFTQNSVCRMMVQVCDGLSALHQCGIIHRDLKPENIMIKADGDVKLIDFDVARIYKNHEEKDTIALGTIGYAAPEQYGETQSDARTDIYALGILMNVMLTGKHPVRETVGGKVGEIIEKCIRVDPNKRYQSVWEIREQLKKLIY